MAGSNPDFSAADFRSGIRLAMDMGAAPEVARQPLFYFPATLSSAAPTDEDQIPFDPTATVVATPTQAPVRVSCGIEYRDTAGDVEGAIGVITQTHLILTFLDEEYAEVEGFEYVMIDGDRYDYQRTEPPRGLFEVGVFRVHVLARDES